MKKTPAGIKSVLRFSSSIPRGGLMLARGKIEPILQKIALTEYERRFEKKNGRLGPEIRKLCLQS